MRLTALASALCVAGLAGLGGVSGASAQALSCGQAYTVKPGDTLQRLTNRAYGPGKSWQLMYRPNSGVIGANPSQIEVGMVLQVPCRDGSSNAGATVAETTTIAARPRATAQVATTPTPTPAAVEASGGIGRLSNKLRIATATDWAPYIDQGQEQGGMIVELVRTALDAEVSKEQYQIDFINDWAAHLDPLIADGAYDFSLIWYRPNCDVIEKLGAESQFRCRNLDWSDPVFEQIVGYYVRSGDPQAPETHSDLFGRTICRPSGFSLFQLEERDLTPPAIELIRAPTVAGCFEQLLDGSVDVVVIATTVADDALQKLGATSLVKDVSSLSSIATLHAVTSINNPRKAQQLAIINAGLGKLRNDGRWFEIVQRHLIAHARRQASQ